MTPNYLISEPSPNPRRPNLLIYSSCHTYGILRYLNEHRPEVRSQYNVTAVVIHLAAKEGGALSDPRLRQAFHQADIVIDHPLASDKWAGFRSEDIGLKPGVTRIRMESPHFNSAWPFHSCNYESELPVRRMLLQCGDEESIRRAFDAGEMNCMFEERFEKDCLYLRGHEKHSDLKFADFVINNFKRQKMFLSPNHPTMAVFAHMMDQALFNLGHYKMGEQHALSLPLETDAGNNHYPETAYEFNYFGFQYPRNYEHNMGGKKFYHSEIARICEG